MSSPDLEEDLRREKPSQPLGASTMNVQNIIENNGDASKHAAAKTASSSAAGATAQHLGFVRPDWVMHMAGKEKMPIFSVDIHPDGTRFATAGGDNKILIWSFPTLIAEAEAADKEGTNGDLSSMKKLLCTISNHVAPVNAVRFSPDASGSDDKYVMIYERQGGPGGAVFGSTEKNVENWKCVANLMGHTADVTMVSWSPDGTRIASSSIDNEVIVWALSGGAPRLFKRLQGHSGLVKGVAFDPIGKYLASQGEDNVVIIWRTSDWEKEAVIDKGKRSTVGSGSFFSRLSWSPDGKALAIPRVLMNGKEVVALAKRGTWDLEHQLVGHHKPTVASAFSPQLWKNEQSSSKKKDKEAKDKVFWICAVGSQDASLSIWFFSHTRPKFIFQELFDQSVVDMAWSRDGLSLIMCSTDGTIVFLRFDGLRPLSAAEAAEYLRAQYGDHVLNSAATPSAIIEDPSLLGLAMGSNAGSNGATPAAAQQPVSHPPPPTTKQVESRANDGRRRITPQFLGGAAPLTVTPAVALPVFAGLSSSQPATATASTAATPSPAPSSVSVPAASLPLALQPSKSSLASSTHSASSPPSVAPPTATPLDITPASVPTSSYPAATQPHDSEDSLLSSRLVGEKRAAEEEPSAAKKLKSLAAKKVAEASKEKEKEPLKESLSVDKEKEKKKEKGPDTEEKKRKKKKSREDGGEKEKEKDKEKKKHKEERRKSDGGSSRLREGPSRILFAEIPAGRVLAIPLNVAAGRPPMMIESIVNPGEEGTQVACTSQGKKLWQERVSGAAILAAGNDSFVAVASNDSSITVFSPAGRRLFAPLILDLPCVSLYANTSSLLLAVTRSGYVHVWDVRLCTCLLRHPLGDAALAAGAVERVELAGNCPTISLANRHTLAYDRNMQTFVRIADPWTQHGSEFASLLQMAKAAPAAAAAGPLSLAPSEGLAGQTVAHLETLLSAAVTLNSASEYRRWLVAYVRKLTASGEAAKLKELCDGLLRRTADARDSLLGVDKREVLRSLLQVMSSNLELQRLVTQYSDMLKESNIL